MAKYYGKIGYVRTVEKVPGVWADEIIEKEHYGDILQYRKLWQLPSENINDDLNVNHRVSIVATPYALQNYPYIKYCWMDGFPWKVNDITVEYPRLILSLGGVYNGETSKTPQESS